MILPLMPKGVEHSSWALGYADLIQVILPLMPKGVEHLISGDKLKDMARRDPASDAERR